MKKVKVLFSEEDSALNNFKWRLNKDGYAIRTIGYPKNKRTNIFAHHNVCLLALGRRPDWSIRESCDHINGDKLDNRRENIRIVNLRCNFLNRLHLYTRKNNPLKMGSVSYDKKCKMFRASFRNKYIGSFSSHELAEIALMKIREYRINEMREIAGYKARAEGGEKV